jgi:hypothetical protein
MAYLGAGVLGVALLYLLARSYTSIDPRNLVRGIRWGVGGIVVAIGAVLTLTGRWSVGLFLVALGISAIVTGRLGPIDLGGGTRTAGSGSKVRSRWFDMQLDHDTGNMTGVVRQGVHTGKSLDDVSDEELLRLRELIGDADSVALLEAYLDRRFPAWRENVEDDAATRPRSAPDAGAMTDEQAYEILGLAPGAGEADIRAAHRRLMKRVHPDQGGSTFLAAKINQAKDRLLGKHR